MERTPKRMPKTDRPRNDLGLLLLSLMLAVTTSSRGVVGVSAAESESVDEQRRLVCYYANWAVYRPGLAKFTPENIDPRLCTHLIYAFAGMNKDYELKPFDSYNDIQLGNYRKFTNLKTYNPKLKVMIAVGGWNEGSKRFSKLVESTSSRSRFVRGAVSFLRKHGFDGLDLDWEYPGSRDGGRESDKRGYAQLVQELRTAFDSKNGSRLLLTMAVPAGKEYIDRGYDVPTLSRHLDFLNLLTYDYHTAQEARVNHHAPLGEEPGLEDWSPDKLLNVEWTVNYYLKLGCPASKLVLGVPTYGRSFTLEDPGETELGAPAQGPGDKGDATREAGYLAYYEICRLIQEHEWELEAPHPSLMGPYAYKDNQWVGFDDEDILLEKVKFVVRRGLGGAMVWTLDNDDFRGQCYGERSPLIATLKSGLERGRDVLSEPAPTTAAATRAPPPSRGTTRSTTATPPPFTTPDPGPAFECEDEGFFNHPGDCRKYFWCLDSQAGLVAHAFTCPAGLHFNKGRDACDYAGNVACKVARKSTTTTTTRRPRPRPKPRKTTTTTSTTTPSTTTTSTTSTTTRAPETEGLNGQNLAELLNLLQQLGGINQIHDRLHGRESAGTTPRYEAPPDRRGGTTAAPPSDLFVQYARPARTRPGAEERTSPVVQPRGPQHHHLPPAEGGRNDEEEEDDEGVRSTESSSIDGFPFVYHTPSRLRTTSEEDIEDTTTAAPPARRRVLVRVHPVTGEASPTEAPPPAAPPKRRPGNRYVPSQTVGVRRQVVRPVNVLEEDGEEDYDVTTPRTTTAAPRRRTRPRTSTTGTTVIPTRRQLIVLPSGKPAVPATTRRRYRTGSDFAPPPEVTRGPSLALLADGGVTCLRRGVHPHPGDCARFIVCVPSSEPGEELDGFIHDCPKGTSFEEGKGRCTNMSTTQCSGGSGQSAATAQA